MPNELFLTKSVEQKLLERCWELVVDNGKWDEKCCGVTVCSFAFLSHQKKNKWVMCENETLMKWAQKMIGRKHGVW